MSRYLEVKVLELVQRGVTDNRAIARKLRCHFSTVTRYRKQHRCSNLRGRAKHTAIAQQAGYADYYAAVRGWAAEGLTNVAIGNRFGCLGTQISIYIREMGGVTRPPGRGRQ